MSFWSIHECNVRTLACNFSLLYVRSTVKAISIHHTIQVVAQLFNRRAGI